MERPGSSNQYGVSCLGEYGLLNNFSSCLGSPFLNRRGGTWNSFERIGGIEDHPTPKAWVPTLPCQQVQEEDQDRKSPKKGIHRSGVSEVWARRAASKAYLQPCPQTSSKETLTPSLPQASSHARSASARVWHCVRNYQGAFTVSLKLWWVGIYSSLDLLPLPGDR